MSEEKSVRRRVAARVVLAVSITAGLSLFAERQPYERYQSIVDRQMFGAPPPGFDPTKPPSEVSKSEAAAAEAQLSKEQEQIRSAIHFSVINVTPSGDTAVGFTDNGDAKNPVHYYLKVGEQRNGWLVKEADPVKATMTIAKGDVEVSLSIGGNSAKGGGSTAKAGAAGQSPAASTMAATGANRPGKLLDARQAGNGGNALNSLRSRRLLREQQRQEEAAEREAAKAEADARRREEEARREEERLQREAEREEQRAQLQQIQEELRKAREERAAAQEPPPQQEEIEPAPEEEDE